MRNHNSTPVPPDLEDRRRYRISLPALRPLVNSQRPLLKNIVSSAHGGASTHATPCAASTAHWGPPTTFYPTIYPKTTAQKHETSTRDIHVTLCSTVLTLRGSITVNQPYQDSDGKYTLCWNGEAWSMRGDPTSGNDTKAIHKLLVEALEPSSRFDEPPKDPFASAGIVSDALSQVAGPYSFVFFDHQRGRLFFGRDFLGRRSLMKRVTKYGDLILSSVSDGNPDENWTEIPADGIYCIDLHVIDPSGVWPGPRAFPGSGFRQMGRFVVGPVGYGFMDEMQFSEKPLKSVIPRLCLNKEMPSMPPSLNEYSEPLARLENLLRDSLRSRILNIPDPPVPATDQLGFERSKLAILFSGGLDCTVLARLAHDKLSGNEHIDLLNVAFENPRIHKESMSTPDNSAYELCPDRLTGRASFEELKKVCPGRKWRFVAINVPYSETLKHRQKVISLMYPHNTEMDLSISYALYFAARGKGTVRTPQDEMVSYTTAARVLLSGLGADELFGGYTRHSNAFRRDGYHGLLDELQLDVARLGQRNLGRDDRVMAHWSKEVRFPYLDEKLVCWALNAPVTDKCGFGEQQNGGMLVDGGDAGSLEPGKKVLRCLAWWLGLKGVAKEKKRAIQFGARTAKMETGKTKGTQLLT